ncbi:MAG TPA: hypothetical protein DIW20_08055, partial [Rhodospirillaceae bacterium]|nr:hypothetical protein [Rhodospirillaceae bacterium]
TADADHLDDGEVVLWGAGHQLVLRIVGRDGIEFMVPWIVTTGGGSRRHASIGDSLPRRPPWSVESLLIDDPDHPGTTARARVIHG